MCAGVSNFSRLGYYYQQQAMLVPTNASDPELQLWWALSCISLYLSLLFFAWITDALTSSCQC